MAKQKTVGKGLEALANAEIKEIAAKAEELEILDAHWSEMMESVAAPVQELRTEVDSLRDAIQQRDVAWQFVGIVNEVWKRWENDPESELALLMAEIKPLKAQLDATSRKVDGVTIPKAPPVCEERQRLDVLTAKVDRLREMPVLFWAKHFGVDPNEAREKVRAENSAWKDAKASTK